MQQLSVEIPTPEHCIRPRDTFHGVVDTTKLTNQQIVSAAHYQINKAAIRARSKLRYHENHTEVLEQAKQRKLALPFKNRVARRIYEYKHKCAKRNYVWKLTDLEASWMMYSPCHYCLAPPVNNVPNGIDRIDNEPLYDLHCTVSCCFTCNRGKNNMSYDAFMAHIANMRRRLDKRDLQE